MRDLTVVTQAVLLQNCAPFGLHDDGFDELLRRELLAMSPAVLGFGDVLGQEGFGQMAVDADRDLMVARLLPGVVLRLHDVAVHARLRILLEIREAFRVAERVAPDAAGNAQADGQHERQQARGAARQWRLRRSARGASIWSHLSQDCSYSRTTALRVNVV